MNPNSSQTSSIDLSRFVGIPYIDKGTDPAKGLDCWQLVKHFYAAVLGKTIPDYMAFYESSKDMEEASKCIEQAIPSWLRVEAPQLGDVLVFRILQKPWHTGIYIGDGKMLHTDEGHGSVIEPIDSMRWKNRLYGAYRWKL